MIKEYLNSKEIIKALKMISYLFLVRGIGYLIIVITNPFYASLLSAEDYGRVGVLWSISLITASIIEFGYPVSAVEALSRSKSLKVVKKLWTLKIILLLAGAAGYFLACQAFKVTVPSALIGFLVPLSAAINANWIYNGLKLHVNLSHINIIGRLFALPFFVIFLYYPSVETAVLFVSFFWFFPALATAYKSIKVLGHFNESTELAGKIKFLPAAYQNIMTVSMISALPLYISTFGTLSFVGVFVALDRTVRSFTAFVYPVTQYLLPRMADGTYNLHYRELSLISFITFLLAFLCSTLLYFFTPISELVSLPLFLIYLPVLFALIHNKLLFDNYIFIKGNANLYITIQSILYILLLLMNYQDMSLTKLLVSLTVVEYILAIIIFIMIQK